MTTTIDISSLAAWGDPKSVSTRLGPKILRTAEVTDAFWGLWRSSKDELKAAGVSVGKNRQTGDWEICWWQSDTQKVVKQEAAIEASKAADADIEIPVPAGLAYLPYQKAGIRYAMEREATLIGDEMGLGKTIQAIGVVNSDPTISRVLIGCPASLKLNWARELARWLTRPLTIGTVMGTRLAGWPDSQVVICNYDVAASHADRIHAVEWDLVILDECHYCKNPKAQRTVAILGKYAKDPEKNKPAVKARRRLALTGTPILNRPIEAQPVLGWLSPSDFGSFWKFATRYANAHQTRWGWDLSGASNLDELQRRLRATVMVRRLKADVLTELPPKRRQVIELPVNGAASAVEAEAHAYRRHQAVIEDLRGAVEVAKLLEDNAAYADAVERLREGQRAMFEDIGKMRHAVAMAKVPYVVAHVTDATDEGPVVLFAHHRDVVAALIDGLTAAGKRCVKVVGGMTDVEKQAAVDDFQGGRADVFVGNIHAAGVGLTLTRSSHVVFAELDWVPANMTQAEDRTHRIGQKASVLVQHLVLEGSLDQVMAAALVRKQDIADAALDDPIARFEASEPVTTVQVNDADAGQPVSTDKPTRTYSDDEIGVLLSGLRRLAGMCDGAHELDGCGFNKMDARYGHALAALSNLTQRQAAVADRLCRKYRRQLGGV